MQRDASELLRWIWHNSSTIQCTPAQRIAARSIENFPLVGSLLLGPYDRNGRLNHVGFTSTIKREDKPALTKKLKSLAGPPGFTGDAPGGPSRWATKRSAEWVPLRPKLVVEVCYD